MLETVPMDGSIVDSVRKYVERLRTTIPPYDFVTITIAERLRIHRIATFDRRPIAVFRPRHVRGFDLEP